MQVQNNFYSVDKDLLKILGHHSAKGFILMKTLRPIDTRYLAYSDDALWYVLGNMIITEINNSAKSLYSEFNIDIGSDGFAVFSTPFESDPEFIRKFIINDSHTGEFKTGSQNSVDTLIYVESTAIHEDGYFTGLLLMIHETKNNVIK